MNWKATVKEFERQQKEHGTLTALQNFQWDIAAFLLKQVGVKRLRTSYKND